MEEDLLQVTKSRVRILYFHGFLRRKSDGFIFPWAMSARGPYTREVRGLEDPSEQICWVRIHQPFFLRAGGINFCSMSEDDGMRACLQTAIEDLSEDPEVEILDIRRQPIKLGLEHFETLV